MEKNLRNNMNLFDKVEWVKKLASEAIGVSDEETLRRLLRRLYSKGMGQYKRYGVLKYTKEELVLDQLLKDYQVSPRTAYRWFMFLKAPQDVRQLAKENMISQNELERRSQGLLLKSTPEQEKLGKEIIQRICALIEVM